MAGRPALAAQLTDEQLETIWRQMVEGAVGTRTGDRSALFRAIGLPLFASGSLGRGGATEDAAAPGAPAASGGERLERATLRVSALARRNPVTRPDDLPPDASSVLPSAGHTQKINDPVRVPPASPAGSVTPRPSDHADPELMRMLGIDRRTLTDD